MGRKEGTVVIAGKTKSGRLPPGTSMRAFFERELIEQCKAVREGLKLLPVYDGHRPNASATGQAVRNLRLALERYMGAG